MLFLAPRNRGQSLKSLIRIATKRIVKTRSQDMILREKEKEAQSKNPEYQENYSDIIEEFSIKDGKSYRFAFVKLPLQVFGEDALIYHESK